MTFQSDLQIAGLIYGPQEHHLDHLGSLCALLDIPLVLTEEALENQARLYYPMLVTFTFDYVNAPSKIILNYDALITAMPSEMFHSSFFLAERLAKKTPLTIWCPHGNSDKGSSSLYIQGLLQEKVVFIYGNKMLDFLNEKEALSGNCHVIALGNYRFDFYQRHKLFYQKIIENEIASKLIKENPTYLYAPTWSDSEKGASFQEALPHLLENLPKDKNLIVKLHPNTLYEEDLKIKKIIWKYESEQNVLFLENFPLIYPLLDFVDLYIGDTSSIGYDFLSFDKPLFFLNMEESFKNRYLHSCGTSIPKKEFSKIYEIIDHHLERDKKYFSAKRKEAMQYTFASTPNFELLSKDLKNLCKSLKKQ